MKVEKKTFATVAFVGIGNFSNAILGFILLSTAAKILSLPDFGKYAILTGLLTLISRIVDFGTNSTYVADFEKDSKHTNNLITSKIVLFLIAVPISVLCLKLFNLLSIDLFIIFFLGLLAYTINYTLYAIYQNKHEFLKIVLLNTIPSVVKASFAIIVILLNANISFPFFFAAFSCSIFSSLLIPITYDVQKIAKLKLIQFNLTDILHFISTAASAGVSQLIYESWQTLNNAIAKIFNTFTEVGTFSLANKIANIFYLISLSVFTVLLPKNRKSANKSFTETSIISVIVILGAFAAVLGSKLFLHKIFADKFTDSFLYIDLLIFASAFSSIQNFVENYFYLSQKTKYMLGINITKLLVLTGVSFSFIPKFGLVYLGYANLYSAIVGLVATVYIISRLEKTKA